MSEYKGYNIIGDGTFGMKKIKPVGAGTLPVFLQGMYTKAIDAMQAIDQYVLIKEERDNKPPRIEKVKLYPREVKNVTESESGD